MSNCDFNKVAKQLYSNRASVWMFYCKLAAYFQSTFSYEHLWTAASDGIRREFLQIYSNSLLSQ